MCIYTYTYIHICMCMCIYIYIYIAHIMDYNGARRCFSRIRTQPRNTKYGACVSPAWALGQYTKTHLT